MACLYPLQLFQGGGQGDKGLLEDKRGVLKYPPIIFIQLL